MLPNINNIRTYGGIYIPIFIILLIFLLALDACTAYKMKVAWSEEYFNIGQKGDERWTTDEEIKQHLKEDDIIVLLISADFINSDYCYEKEMKTAFERMEKKEAVVVPVIVRPCYWKTTPLGDIQALPKDGKPISKYQDEDDAYVEIVESISNIIDDFNQ